MSRGHIFGRVFKLALPAIVAALGMSWLPASVSADIGATNTFRVVKLLVSHDSNRLYVVVDKQINAPACSQKDRFALPLSAPATESVQSIALAALLSGRPIEAVYNNGEHVRCEGGGIVPNIISLAQ